MDQAQWLTLMALMFEAPPLADRDARRVLRYLLDVLSPHKAPPCGAAAESVSPQAAIYNAESKKEETL